jgi:hypothetical protein
MNIRLGLSTLQYLSAFSFMFLSFLEKRCFIGSRSTYQTDKETRGIILCFSLTELRNIQMHSVTCTCIVGFFLDILCIEEKRSCVGGGGGGTQSPV